MTLIGIVISILRHAIKHACYIIKHASSIMTEHACSIVDYFQATLYTVSCKIIITFDFERIPQEQ